jgi:hypothetical protein
MRGEFQGGVCDGHSHPVGPEPTPRRLDAVCSLGAGNAARGHYVFSGTRTQTSRTDAPPTTVAVLYQWQPDDEPDVLSDQSA